MKRKLKMPKDEERKYPLVPVGERFFQVTDIIEENEIIALIKCEAIDPGGMERSLLYQINLDQDSDFLWLTKLFLKCIGEPHEGEPDIDPENWIGRRFYGEVKHSANGEYANIKKLNYKEIDQHVHITTVTDEEVKKSDLPAWDD